MAFRPVIDGEAVRSSCKTQMQSLGCIDVAPTTDARRIMHCWLPLFSVLILTSACTHVRAPEVTSTGMRADINRRAQTKTVVIHLQDDRRIPAEGLHVGPDTASWFHAETGAFLRVPTHEIQTVRFARRGRGALIGAVGGFAAGLIVGHLRTKSWSPAEEDCEEETPCGVVKVFAESARRVGIALGGLVGAGLGAIAGVMVGQPVVYHLSALPQQPASASEASLSQWWNAAKRCYGGTLPRVVSAEELVWRCGTAKILKPEGP
jgi:hypothetical protein